MRATWCYLHSSSLIVTLRQYTVDKTVTKTARISCFVVVLINSSIWNANRDNRAQETLSGTAAAKRDTTKRYPTLFPSAKSVPPFHYTAKKKKNVFQVRIPVWMVSIHKTRVKTTTTYKCLMYHAACKNWVSTIQTVVLTSDVFQLLIKRTRIGLSDVYGS